MTPLPGAHSIGAVLAGVKAKPSGWPTASPDTGLRAAPPKHPAGNGRKKIRST